MEHILTPYECILIYLGDYSKEQQYASSLLLKMYFKNRWYELLQELKEASGFRINNRLSSKAKIWAKKIKKRANYKCEMCGSDSNLHAHHIIEWQYSIKGRLDLDNGQCLCEECHKKVHNDKYVLKVLGDKYA